jgi:AbiJ N-terminal domain 4
MLRDLVLDIFDPYGIDPPPELSMRIQALAGESDASIQFRRFLLYCPWYRVYELIEELLERLEFHEAELADPEENARYAPLQAELNKYFEHAGIGWQLVDGKVITRGEEVAQQAFDAAVSRLEATQRPTAASHIRSASKALSERPSANTAGAVSQATAAVESLLSDITNQEMSLGKYLDKYPKLIHPALKRGLDGVYGYACDAGARHGKEGKVPTFDKAQFALTICAAACTLLSAIKPMD